MNTVMGCSCVPSSVCIVYIHQLSHYQAVLLSCYHASIPLASQCSSFPFLIGRTSPLTHQQCLLQLVLPLKECLTLALYSPSLASSSLSSPILERSEYCITRACNICNYLLGNEAIFLPFFILLPGPLFLSRGF